MTRASVVALEKVLAVVKPEAGLPNTTTPILVFASLRNTRLLFSLLQVAGSMHADPNPVPVGFPLQDKLW